MIGRIATRRTLKWTCTIACGLLATVFLASVPVFMNTGTIVATHGIELSVIGGVLSISDVDTTWSDGTIPSPYARFLQTRFDLQWHDLDWWPTPLIQSHPGFGLRWGVQIPLWLPLLVLLLPTLWLWRIDRRRPRPGHCRQCNYNLTGNTSGRCPECGAEILKGEALSANEAGGGDATGA